MDIATTIARFQSVGNLVNTLKTGDCCGNVHTVIYQYPYHASIPCIPSRAVLLVGSILMASNWRPSRCRNVDFQTHFDVQSSKHVRNMQMTIRHANNGNVRPSIYVGGDVANRILYDYTRDTIILSLCIQKHRDKTNMKAVSICRDTI